MTNPFKPISRVNLHSEVMQQITAAIQSGQWKPGSKLPGEIALAEMFQVSRTCIREVLKALAYSGVVESRSGVGTFVKEIPSEAPSPRALSAHGLRLAGQCSGYRVAAAQAREESVAYRRIQQHALVVARQVFATGAHMLQQ